MHARLGAAPDASVARSVIDALPLGVVVTDPEGRAEMVNRSWLQLTGQTEPEARDHGWLDALGVDRLARRSAMLAAARSGSGYSADWEIDTPERACVLRVAAVPDLELGDGPLRRIIVTASEVTAETARARQLAYRATHDHLTGLLNRAEFLDVVRASLARRPRSAALLTVVFVDVDGLKATNDALGHAAGDALLEHVAAQIIAAVRPGDVVARYGGDEFTVLCEGLPGAEEATAIAARIRTTVTRVPCPAVPGPISVSVGVAVADPRDVDPDDLVNRADRAMHRAKRGAATGSGMQLAPDSHLDLLATTAHEMRAPLTAITGYASLLKARHADGSPDEIDGVTEIIHRQATHLATMIDDLLDLGRMSRALPVPAPVELDELIVQALEAAPAPPDRSVTVDAPGSGGLPPVLCDRSRVARAIVNLLTNAYRYGGPNIVVRARLAGDVVAVEVEDDGDGVPEGLVASLFTPFVSGGNRGDGETGAGGTGLGLAIARQAVESVGGELTFGPLAPHGARFTIRLRAATGSEDGRAELSPAASGR